MNKKTQFWELQEQIDGYVRDSGYDAHVSAKESMRTLLPECKEGAFVQYVLVTYFDNNGNPVGSGSKWVVFVRED